MLRPFNAQSALLLLIPLALSCRTDPEIPAIAGEWEATDTEGERWELEIVNDNPGGMLTGTVTIQLLGEGSLAWRDNLTGSYDYPAVAWKLWIHYQGGSSWRCDFRGTMAQSGATFTGNVTCAQTGGGPTWSSPLDFRRLAVAG